MDSKQIDEAMRKKLSVYHKGHRYECILEYVMFYDHNGRTRLSLHKGEYLALKTDKEREAFLQDMNDHCREWKKKKYRYRTVWGDGMMVKRRVKK